MRMASWGPEVRRQRSEERHVLRASPRGEREASPRPATARADGAREPRSMLDYLQYIMNPDSNGPVLSPKVPARGPRARLKCWERGRDTSGLSSTGCRKGAHRLGHWGSTEHTA